MTATVSDPGPLTPLTLTLCLTFCSQDVLTQTEGRTCRADRSNTLVAATVMSDSGTGAVSRPYRARSISEAAEAMADRGAQSIRRYTAPTISDFSQLTR